MRYTKFTIVILILFLMFSIYHHFKLNKQMVPSVKVRKDKMKYILQWTLPNTIPFVEMKSGQDTFIERKCSFTNCFVTPNKTYLKSIADYDVIVLHGPELTRKQFDRKILTLKRDPKQKYVFVSIESSHYYPLNSKEYNNFFNWTWTYKLDSDVPYAYITVRDKKGDVVAPSANVKWISQSDMEPISVAFRDRLKSKRKAAAWMVSNCNALSKRQDFVKSLQEELKKYGLEVDVYGKCGTLKCPVEEPECLETVERDYYFYLSFENSFSPDYVTEKLLNGLQHNAVPVVLGAANYSCFMPPGSYLDATELGVAKLASRMHELILVKPGEYHDMFRWRNHYSFHDPREAPDSDPLCRLCEMMNDEELMRKTTVYERFDLWWNVK